MKLFGNYLIEYKIGSSNLFFYGAHSYSTYLHIVHIPIQPIFL